LTVDFYDDASGRSNHAATSSPARRM
jgi:hypothetical protein